MKTHRLFNGNWRGAAMGIWMALAICLSAGCAKRVEYVNSEHRLTRIQQGQPAPRQGVLISDGYLAELYDALGQPRPKLEEKTSASPPAETPKK